MLSRRFSLALLMLAASSLSTGVDARARHHAPASTYSTYDSGSDYYTNVDGNRVHRPVRGDSRPSGATARCADGSWSFSQNHRGTCSHHGGVSQWLD
jgi:hypothetical protein